MKKVIFKSIGVIVVFLAGMITFSCKNPDDSDKSSSGDNFRNGERSRCDNGGSGILLQGFTWTSNTKSRGTSKSWYSVIEDNKENIKDVFEYVWFPPCSDSNSENGYLPRKLNDLDSSKYGNKEQLKSAVQSIKTDYTKAICDVVINHRCGTTSWGDFTAPSFGTEKGQNYRAICRDDEGFENDSYMKQTSSSKRGNYDSGDKYGSGRDLDHSYSVVRDEIVTWMNTVLKDCGFVGWRYDMVSGYDGKYVGYYNAKTDAEFSVGEYWNDNSKIPSWIKKTALSIVDDTECKGSRAFDFELKKNLNSVFGGSATSKIANKNYNLLASKDNLYKKDPGFAVTFVENHDTGSTQNQWPMDPNDVATAYAFILTHPGYPSVAWFHYFSAKESDDTHVTANKKQYLGDQVIPGSYLTYKSFIKKLIELRKECGINDQSAVKIITSKSTLYSAEITGSNNSLIVAIGESIETPENYKLFLSGTDFQIFIKQ